MKCYFKKDARNKDCVIFRLLFVLLLLLPILSVHSQNKIVSKLEVYDLETKQHRVIKEFPYLIEAPNWTPDGQWLIYNSKGRLYRLAADGSGEPQLINTDFATACNNDHVLSTDGRWIGISYADGDWQKSRVYILPAEGGTPRMITPQYPSFLHGISPDGKEVAYCAFRGEQKPVCTMSVEGGEEHQLTSAPGLNDGPEYAPNGKYIWFNSVRTGLMQIWRMKRDGSDQQQMTFDDNLNAWFPHISPNGKWVVYLAYHKGDLQPGEHVANKNVVLRLMKPNGKKVHTIVELFGGQGTINVNSWAPDSKRFAFVSYQK